MAFRIFIACVALACAFLAFQIYGFSWARAHINDVPAGYAGGPENADVTVVEFLDYACKNCKDAHPVLMQAIREDGNIRHIPRPMISATDAGDKYVRMAYAAGLQGKFMKVHEALITSYRVLDDTLRAEIAKNTGLDLERLKADEPSQTVSDLIAQNGKLYPYFYNPHLPNFVINGRIIFAPVTTTPTVQDFKQIFAQARAEAQAGQ